MANAEIADLTGKRPPAAEAGLPSPLGEVGSLEDRFSQIGLMGDDQRRYRQKSAEAAVALPKERVASLLGRFGPRLRVLPFSSSGIPSEEEASLTRDLWSALTDSERGTIVENTAQMVAENRATPRSNIPDQTPYAKRLLHRNMWMKAKEA